MKIKNKAQYLGIVGLILFLLVWEFVSVNKLINPFFIGSPSKAFVALYEMFASGSIYPHLLISGREFFLGFMLAIIVGILLGFLISSSRFLSELTRPFITGLYNTPRIILLPLLIIWLGIGLSSKVFLIFLIAVFPILINTIAASKNVDRNLILMAKSFNARKITIFANIIFPSAFPYILAGIELAIGRALTGIVVSEIYGGRGGVGYLASYYGQTFQINKLVAVIFIFIIFSLLLTKIIHYVSVYFHFHMPDKQDIDF